VTLRGFHSLELQEQIFLYLFTLLLKPISLKGKRQHLRSNVTAPCIHSVLSHTAHLSNIRKLMAESGGDISLLPRLKITL